MTIPKEAFQVDAEIARAWTLPASLYTDSNVFVQENERIFSRTWQVMGHVSRVANPGDYFTTELGGEPLLFVWGTDGKLRGFYNVCRHRAGPPAEGCGSRKLFRCRYHGWTYGLDGALNSATEIEGVQDNADFPTVPRLAHGACPTATNWKALPIVARPIRPNISTTPI